MGNSNSLRLCLSCFLPCGALDVIRVVHINGQVDELTPPAIAGEILAANPGHFISELSSQGVSSHRILIVPPETELRRGHIYFLIPATAAEKKKKKRIFKEKVASPEKSPEKKVARRRVAVWRPNLDSISEDLQTA